MTAAGGKWVRGEGDVGAIVQFFSAMFVVVVESLS